MKILFFKHGYKTNTVIQNTGIKTFKEIKDIDNNNLFICLFTSRKRLLK